MTPASTVQPTGASPGDMSPASGNGPAAGVGRVWPDALAPGSGAAPPPRVNMAVADWDVMFEAVRARLTHSVGERLGELPELPQHSAELSASLVQAVVLDCVNALGQLHDALQHERSQRLTP